MHFRPLPVLTVLAIPVLAVLLWLGSWQLDRARWKTRLIGEFERQAASDPMSIDAAFCSVGDPVGRILSGQQVKGLIPPADPERTVRMFGGNEKGDAGWRLLVAGQPPTCVSREGQLVIWAGFEPIPGGAPVRSLAERYVVTQWPTKGAMEAANAPNANDWHWFDVQAMADALDAPKLNGRYYVAPFSGQLPDALARVPPAQHYGYAITWFGMAVALLVIYGAFHARAGRLRFSSDKA
jgi:surfeit locus 1 family protein